MKKFKIFLYTPGGISLAEENQAMFDPNFTSIWKEVIAGFDTSERAEMASKFMKDALLDKGMLTVFVVLPVVI